MLNMRKTMSIVLALVLTVCMAACSGGNNSGKSSENGSSASGTGNNAGSGNKNSNADTPASTGNAAADSGSADTSKEVELSILVPGDPPTNGTLEKVEAKWNDLFKQMINATVKLKWVGWTDWQTKYDLAMASGEAYDLIVVGDWLNFWANSKKGAYMNLEDLLPKAAPELWSEFKEDWPSVTNDGHITMIPETHYSQWTDQGIYYRGDWAKEFGITEPIKDFDTLGKYLQGIKDKKKGVIPYDVTAGTKYEPYWGWVQSHTDALLMEMVPTGFLHLFWGKSYYEKYTAWSPVFDQTFVDEAVMMKDWADKGYWRKDALNFTGDTRAELQEGKTGTDAHHSQTFRGLRATMDQKQPGSELQMFAYADTRGNLMTDSPVHGGFAVGANSKNPERALMALELIHNDPDIYRLFQYGIEGEQYVVKDGLRAQPDGYDPAKSDFFSNMWGARNDKNEIPSKNEYAGIYDMFKEKAAKAKRYPYASFVFDKTPVQAELSALSNVTSTMGPAIIWGKAGDPVKAVENFRKKLKAAGYDKVLAELQKQLDAYKAKVEG
ncbi:DUF3502 domain-containing protein [Paenibacillus gansuensis]|uniref:DUF3502 domain-containing protein n=1 Tax=Paenibacillus gansuensis TaxID=306542 RepID=A0ABW5P870_9BACL